MPWHHAYANYQSRPKDGKKDGDKDHFVKWWDTREGEREMQFDRPEHFLRTVLDIASRDGWEFVAQDTHTLIFKKPVG